ncbi:MAG: O-antigen ligase family protein [Planctomycetaceae bacterium]|nr:O-antigen ligase family protein [Planctomycetaceae bacterium]
MTLLEAWKRQQFSSATRNSSHTAQRPTTGSERLEIIALGISAATLNVVPWLLGGFIPHARLALLAGAIVSGLLVLLARVLQRFARSSQRDPHERLTPLSPAVLLFTAMAMLGLLQLLPIFQPPLQAMHHAAEPVLRNELQPEAASKYSPRTVCTADTRLATGQYLALAILTGVIAETVSKSRKRLIRLLAFQAAGACTVTIAGWLSLFDQQPLGIAEQWMIGRTIPFGPFVNPNNAAGWLCVQLGMSLGLVILLFDERIEKPKRSYNFEKGFREFVARQVERLQGRLSALNSAQILGSLSFVIIAAGIASTLSRSGIVGAIFGLLIGALSRLQIRGIVFFAVATSLLVAVSIGLITLFEFDEGVLLELSTLDSPVAESTGRLEHWSDSLRAVADFPLIGAGLGCYRMINQPYVDHDTRVWFQKADNQLVETVVECGGIGLLLYLGLGVFAFSQALRISRRVQTVSRHRRPLYIAISLIAAVSSGTLVVTSLFDYATGLPAVAGAFACVLGIAAGRHNSDEEAPESRTKREARRHRHGPPDVPVNDSDGESETTSAGDHEHRQHRDPRPGLTRRSTWMYGMLVLASFPFLADAWAAARIYDLTVAATRLQRQPEAADTDVLADRVLIDLQQALQHRPDDPDGLDAVTRLTELRWRTSLLKALRPEFSGDQNEFRQLWQALSPPELAARLIWLRQASPDEAAQLQQIIDQRFDEFPWHTAAAREFAAVPFYPGAATHPLFALALRNPDASFESAALQQ